MVSLGRSSRSEALDVIGQAINTQTPLNKASLLSALKLPSRFDSQTGYTAYRQLSGQISKAKLWGDLRQEGNRQILTDIREVLKFNDEGPRKLRRLGVFEDKLDKYSGSEKIAASDFVMTVLKSIDDYKKTGSAISEVLGYFDITPANQRADLLKAFDKAFGQLGASGKSYYGRKEQEDNVRLIKTLSRALNDKPQMSMNDLSKRIDAILANISSPSSPIFKFLFSHPASSIDALLSEVKRLSIHGNLELKEIERLSKFFLGKNPNRDAIVEFTKRNNFNLDALELFDSVKPKEWSSFSKYVEKGQFNHYPTLKLMAGMSPELHKPFAEHAPVIGQKYPETLKLMLKTPVSDWAAFAKSSDSLISKNTILFKLMIKLPSNEWQNYAENAAKMLKSAKSDKIVDYLERMIKLPLIERSEFIDVYLILGDDAAPLRDTIAKLPQHERIPAAEYLAKLTKSTTRTYGSYDNKDKEQIESGKKLLKCFPSYFKTKLDAYFDLSEKLNTVFSDNSLATRVDVINQLHNMEAKGYDITKYVDAAVSTKISDLDSFKVIAGIQQNQVEHFSKQVNRLETSSLNSDTTIRTLKSVPHEDLKLFVDIANEAKAKGDLFLTYMKSLPKEEWANFKDSYLAVKPYSYGLEKVLAKANYAQRLDAAKYMKQYFDDANVSGKNKSWYEERGSNIMYIFNHTAPAQRDNIFKAVKDIEVNHLSKNYSGSTKNAIKDVSYRVNITYLFTKANVPVNQINDFAKSAAILGNAKEEDIKALLKVPHDRLSHITEQAKRIGVKPVNENYIKAFLKLDNLEPVNAKPSLTHFVDQWLKTKDTSLERVSQLLSIPFKQLEYFVDTAAKYKNFDFDKMATMQSLKSTDWEPYAKAHTMLEHLNPNLTQVLGGVKTEDRHEVIGVWKGIITPALNNNTGRTQSAAETLYKIWQKTPVEKRQQLLALTSDFNKRILNDESLESKVRAYDLISQHLNDTDNTAAVIKEVGNLYKKAKATNRGKAQKASYALDFMPKLLAKNVESVQAYTEEAKRFKDSFDAYLGVLSKVEQSQIKPLVNDALHVGVKRHQDLARFNKLKYWQRPALIKTAEKLVNWNGSLTVLEVLQKMPVKDHKGTIQLANSIIQYGDNVTAENTLVLFKKLSREERQQVANLALYLEPDQVNDNTLDTIVDTPKRSRERHVLGLMRPREACGAEEDRENVQRGNRQNRTKESLERLIINYPVVSEKEAEVIMRKEILPFLREKYDQMIAESSDKRSSRSTSLFNKNKLKAKMKGADLFTGQSVPKEYRLTMAGRALDAVLRPYSSQMHDYTQPLIKNHLFTKGFPGMTQIAVLTWSLVHKYDGQDKKVDDPKYVMPKAEKVAMQASLKSAYFKAVAGCIDPDDGHRVCSVGLSQQFATVLQGYYPEIDIEDFAIDDDMPLTPINVYFNEICNEYRRDEDNPDIFDQPNKFFDYVEQSAKEYYGDDTDIFKQCMKEQLVSFFNSCDIELPASAQKYSTQEA